MPTTPLMIMIFAMVLTFSMFVTSEQQQSNKSPDDDETAAADVSREPSNLFRLVLTELPLVYHCNDSLQCPAAFGFTRCENHLCKCDESFYQVFNKTSETAYCRLCSLFQESCAVTQCCENPDATFCFNGLCVCRPGMDEECLGRYTPTLGIQLANTLSVSFAFVFLAITLVAVVRKTLFRCSFCRCDSMSRVASDSSLNEFVKQKMQNRPPCYDDIEKDRKVPIFDCTNQPPPEYGATHFSRPGTFHQGTLNPSLSISNEVEMNMAPPNYSTFTTVTEVPAMAAVPSEAAVGRTSGEIILTQPIYTNRDFPRLA
ncbi:uncharacterized protein LOC132938357 isoform X2 [Metopolophium dirhodum]|uniref:uncharacterized protein LOC132938357 isoform X2 n=1 Tax=Metopolophium dirhodum TaxID=44670 RepID=UPI00298F52CB|nr:uncharacterized protein LOC132938357 isoform X2 [Metopolophium dirhodum]